MKSTYKIFTASNRPCYKLMQNFAIFIHHSEPRKKVIILLFKDISFWSKHIGVNTKIKFLSILLLATLPAEIFRSPLLGKNRHSWLRPFFFHNYFAIITCITVSEGISEDVTYISSFCLMPFDCNKPSLCLAIIWIK